MVKKKATFFEVLVYVAYGYFMLIGLVWLVMSFVMGSFFNYWAFSLMAVFAAQAWYRHKLTNLILGVVTLAASIFGALQFMWLGNKTGFDVFVAVMFTTSVLALIMSGVLIFSYSKLSFMEQS